MGRDPRECLFKLIAYFASALGYGPADADNVDLLAFGPLQSLVAIELVFSDVILERDLGEDRTHLYCAYHI